MYNLCKTQILSQITKFILLSCICLSTYCRSSEFAFISKNGSILENLNIVISDKEGKPTTYETALKAINKKMDQEVSIKIYAFLILEEKSFCPKDIYYASSTSIKTTSNELKSVSETINIAGLKKDTVYNLGLIFSENITKNISSITNNLQIVHNKRFYRDEAAKAKELTQSLKAYVESPQSDPTISAFFYKYFPFLPIVLDLFSPFWEDKNLFTGRISLLKSSSFMPDLLDLLYQGGNTKLSYVVIIDQYTFTSVYLVRKEIIQTLNEIAGEMKSTGKIRAENKSQLNNYAKNSIYHKYLSSIKDSEDFKNLCKDESFKSINSYYRQECANLENNSLSKETKP